jgi:SH3 domain protein
MFLWRVPLMKRIIFVGIWLFLFSTVVQAKTMYVSDQVEITLRTGRGTNHKIISMIKSGDAVEVLTPGNNWTQVRTSNGKRGWVLSRFLKSEIPSRVALERLDKKHKVLLAQVEPSLNEITALKGNNAKLRSELARIEETLNEKNRAYEILKTESTKFLKLKSEFKKIKSQLEKERQKADKLDEDLTNELRQKHIWWFLCGAGVLLLGFMIGFSAKRPRRRPSLL